MKALSVLLILTVTNFAMADGRCVTNDSGAHEDFCVKLDRAACATHKTVCSWEASKVKTMKITSGGKTETVKVEEIVDHSCAAKDGMEVHEDFCKGQGKTTCKVHSMCEWN